MSVSRRQVLKASAAGAAALAAPAVLRAHDALASSGQVNVFAWGDYVQQNMVEKFEKDTGIKINLSTYGSNDEAEQKLKAAGGKASTSFSRRSPTATTIIPMTCCSRSTKAR
jgi:spermidine/putrescine transport system substrate-binding protein